MWSALSLLNRILRRLRVPKSIWKIRGQWYIIRDEPGSLTPVIVEAEIRRGLYNANPRPGTTVLDVGAHVGMFTIPLARENPKVTFWCYEPNPRNYANLIHNLRRNHITNAFPVNAGIAPSKCQLQVTLHDSTNTGASMSREGSSGVPGYPLGNLLWRHNPTILKVDVEGMEFSALNASDLHGVDLLIMEVHGQFGNPETMLTAAQGAKHSRLQVIKSKMDGIYEDGQKVKP